MALSLSRLVNLATALVHFEQQLHSEDPPENAHLWYIHWGQVHSVMHRVESTAGLPSYLAERAGLIVVLHLFKGK